MLLLAFTLGNFWGNHNEARSATLDEATMYARAASITETIPADQGGMQMMAALENYRNDISEVQWPLLQRADSAGAYAVQLQATGAMGKQPSLRAGRVPANCPSGTSSPIRSTT